MHKNFHCLITLRWTNSSNVVIRKHLPAVFINTSYAIFPDKESTYEIRSRLWSKDFFPQITKDFRVITDASFEFRRGTFAAQINKVFPGFCLLLQKRNANTTNIDVFGFGLCHAFNLADFLIFHQSKLLANAVTGPEICLKAHGVG